MKQRRGNGNTNNGGGGGAIENLDDILGETPASGGGGGGDTASVPRSVPATFGMWDATSVMSSSTFGNNTINNLSGANMVKKDDEQSAAGTLTSRGVESLIFSGLSNIDENNPLRNFNNNNKNGKNKNKSSNNNNNTAGNNISTDNNNAGTFNISSGNSITNSINSNRKKGLAASDERSLGGASRASARSVFTEKKQEDIDRLFDDLLGGNSDQHHNNNNNNGDDISTASTAMSSLMPIKYGNANKNNNTPVHRNRNSNKQHGSSGSSVSFRDTYSSNQYIFNNNNNGNNPNDHPHANNNHETASAQHDLLYYGDKDDTSKVSSSVLDRFARFYRARMFRVMHVKAGLILMFLVSVMFVFAQVSVVSEHNSREMQRLRSQQQATVQRRTYHTNNNIQQHDEMVDRPNSQFAMDARQKNKPHAAAAATTATAAVLGGGGRGTLTTTTETGAIVTTNNNNNNNNKGPVVDPLPAKKQDAQAVADPKKLPDSFQYIADLDYNKASKSAIPYKQDMPYLWQVPRAGSGTLRDILSLCMGIVLAAEPGGKGPFAGDKSLEVFQEGTAHFLNVDTTYLGGIARAKQLDLVSSHKADVVVSPYVHQLSEIFTADRRGRMFAFVRHPVERCASMYAFKKTVDPEIARMTLLDYAQSGRVENNWMTRFLSNQLTGEITFEHLVLAKEVLRTKCLIGLKEYLWASIKRFEMYFGWEYTTEPETQYQCRQERLLEDTDATKYPQPVVKEGTREWTMLLWQNKFDMKLYKYAQELFQEQVALFPEGTVPKDQ